MKIKLYLNKSVHENAALYYEQAKEARKKRDGLKKAIEETEKEIRAAEKNEKQEQKKPIRIKREKKWFEKFNWFETSEGKLAFGGRNAQQNDQVVAKHMDEHDLFFHADIQGGSAVVLKGGVEATEQEMQEAAQFAASFSSAWKNANAAVDVYAVRKEQLSKASQGGYIPTGAFAISGERIWFRSSRLRLRIGMDPESKLLMIIPGNSQGRLDSEIELVPSRTGKEKGALAKSLSKRLDVHPDELLEMLPSGKSKTILKN